MLGSSQSEADVDRGAAGAKGIEVVRRRSGGGAVLVVPGDLVWVELAIAGEDPLWETDVSRSALWLGGAWARALKSLGFVQASVHAGPSVRTAWSAKVCFAGLGPGEVLVAGKKVVGISQRRTRDLAWFQCAVILTWDPSCLVELLGLDPRARSAPSEIGSSATGLGSGLGVGDVEEAFLAQLP